MLLLLRAQPAIRCADCPGPHRPAAHRPMFSAITASGHRYNAGSMLYPRASHIGAGGFRRASFGTFIGVLGTLLLLVGCDRDSDQDLGEAPPPVASARPNVCAAGGGTARYDAELFPKTAVGFCIDPHGETRAYGAGAPDSLDDVCIQLFNGECEVYKRFGLERVTTLRYVDGTGTPATVSVTVSRFARRAGAFGFFTKRVVADGDPARATVEPLEAGTAAALGSGIAYVWRGRHVVELSYTNEIESPDQMRKSSARVLPGLAKAIGAQLPGVDAPLADVAILPQEHRLALGLTYGWEKLLGVSATGAGAVGHYAHDGKRWRVMAALREDEQGAKDLLGTLTRAGSSKKLKHRDAVSLRLASSGDGPASTWLLKREGRAVIGVGDESFGPLQGDASSKAEERELSEETKLKRLKEVSARALAASKVGDK